ncbi:hypothetical protein R3I94_022081 [Phoxinus phoxinus]
MFVSTETGYVNFKKELLTDYTRHTNSLILCEIMKLVIFLWILPVTLGDIFVTCIYSAECLLPCTSTNLDIIHWYKDSKPVHSFYYNQDQLSHQSEDYKGRTSLLPESEIKNGNVSLLLKNIRVQDEGRYRCYTANDKTNDEQFVSVSVEAPVKSVDITLKDDTVTCSTSGVYPQPEVSWSSDPPANEPLNTFPLTEEKLFMVTSELKVGVTSTYKYSCSITSKGRTKTATLEEQAVSELPENEFIFKCPVPKDVNYTLILQFSTTVLTYDSKTSMKEISEQWKDKVTFTPENGEVKLSLLNKEQLGRYTCESTSADGDRHIMQALVSSRDLETVYICIGIIAAIIAIAIAIAIFVVIKRKKSQNKFSKDTEIQRYCRTASQTSKKGSETEELKDNGNK